MKRCVGLCTSRKRRWRQPSLQVESFDSPTARVVLDRELADVEPLLGGADHHLGGELHARRAQVEARQDVAADAAHAAVRVAHAGAEEEVEDARQDRVADVAVQPRHRARLDVRHAVADHHVGAVVEPLDEARDLGEVVRQVGVGHHDVLAARRAEAGQIGAAVAALGLVDDARSGRRGELGAAVGRAVVGDDDLARDAASRSSAARARTTHSSIVSASFRHGMTTETRSASPSSGSVAGAWVSVVDAMAGGGPAVASRGGPGR